MGEGLEFICMAISLITCSGCVLYVSLVGTHKRIGRFGIEALAKYYWIYWKRCNWPLCFISPVSKYPVLVWDLNCVWLASWCYSCISLLFKEWDAFLYNVSLKFILLACSIYNSALDCKVNMKSLQEGINCLSYISLGKPEHVTLWEKPFRSACISIEFLNELFWYRQILII